MAEALFSSSWYRVADLKPRLRGHVRIHRHDYRGDIWYVLEDPSSGQFHRLSLAAHYVVTLMDGDRSVQEIWEQASAELGDDAPTQDEVIRFLGQLHAINMLQTDVAPDSAELYQRHEKHLWLKWKQRLLSPLAVRFPLFDPDQFLRRWLPVARPVFSWLGGIAWLSVVVIGAVLGAMHWTDLTQDGIDAILTAQNLLIIWLAYPVVKALHEFGHAFAVKVWGGEVHEMGIMLLVLMPIPYVEASAASAFQDKYRRVIVGAAGIMVELFLAAVALIVWVNVEPGIVRSVAYNVALIGSVSTLLFNGNPLLRFDGYYILADAIEIPNLATRARKYLAYLVHRYLFGLSDVRSPATAAGERAWFLSYGLASFAYRLFIMFAIVLLVASKLFFVGVLLAIWAGATQIVMPLAKGIGFLLTSPQLQRRRVRAVLTSTLAVGLVVGLVFFLPVPLWTRTEGVVWLPEQSHVRAGTDGFVVRLLAPDGTTVRRDEPLIETADPLLPTRVRLLEARLRELDARLAQTQFADRSEAEIVRQERRGVIADLARARELKDALVIRSPTDGAFVVPDAADLPGRYFRHGELLGYVVDDSEVRVRAVVGQEDIALVRERTRGVDALLDDWHAETLPAAVLREVPGATDELPSSALGRAGGGEIAVDPRDPEGRRTLERLFQLDIFIPGAHLRDHMGGRVLVRLDHGYEPLAFQWYRTLRQLFLSRFAI